MSNRKQVNLEELPEAAQQLVKKTDWHIDEDDFVLYHHLAKKDEPMLSHLNYDFSILSYVFETYNTEIERTAVWYATNCSIYRKINERELAYVLFGNYKNETKELILVEYP